jgi:hypothetical protein
MWGLHPAVGSLCGGHLTSTTACSCKVVDVPEDCVGFVMGRGGNTLRSMEEEWGSLMFFAQVRAHTLVLSSKRGLFSRRGWERNVRALTC